MAHSISRRLVPLAVALAAVLPGQDSGAQRLTPELLWQLRRVSDPKPDPTGQYLLYAVRTYDIDENSGTTQLYLLDLRKNERRQLTTQGSNFSACWSPSGDAVAFLSTRGGAPQIYRMRIDGGEPTQVTSVEGGVANLAWSPDGAHFSFTADVSLDPDVHDRYPDLPEAEVKIYDSLLFRHWDQWKDGTYSHLFVVPVDGGEPRDLMPGERFDTPVKPFGGGEQIAWSPDGKELCYTAKKVEGTAWVSSTDNDLYVVPVDGGPAVVLTDANPGYDQEPVYSPDGKWIAYHSMERAGFESDRNRIMLYERATGAITELTRGHDMSTHGVAWAPDSAAVYFSADVKGTTQVFRLALPGSGGLAGARALSRGRAQVTGPVPSADGAWVYCTAQSTERPYEIVRLPVGAESPTEPRTAVLTHENDALYASLELPVVEERWFPATDGKQIHSWVIKPPGFDPARRYPMLLYCQGGPQSQVGQWFSYRWNFHLMAAQGYVVLAVNRRGLPGFGQEWNDQISRDWGGQAMQDLLTATDAMQQEPYIDAERTAAVGASFGGYTVFWLMGNDDRDRFCTMIAHCGVFNLESMYLSTEELFFVNWDLGGPFWQDPEVWEDYERFSPHRKVANWTTPLLVIHGARDYRVPDAQGLQAFTAAQVQGVPSRLLYFPDEGHWVLSPQNGLVWHREFFAWLDRFCKPEGAVPASGGGAAAARAVDADASGDAGVGDRRYLLERVDDTAVVQLYADGFEQLSLRDKQLCYHLAQAAIAGRDIFIDQKFEENLPIRDLLEELYLHRGVLGAELGAEIERYTKLFWVHNGVHNAITTKKERLNATPEQLRAAVAAARADGAQIAFDDARLAALFAVLTDPSSFASCTNKSPEHGDVLAESANNLYAGVTSADLEGFDERYPLNSRLWKRPDGGLVEQVYRAGDGATVPPGLYARELNAVIGHLRAALPFAPPPTQKALRHLIRYYETGDPEDWRRFNIAWVQDTDSVVDQINGFVEVYLDARGQKGAWEAVVSFLNVPKTAAIEKLAAEAQWFEERMPWDDEFKKENVVGISARSISVITETGDSGPITPIGINLPNETDIREQYGSKSVNLSNVVEAYEESRAGGSAAEFAWSQAEVERAAKWGAISGDIHTNLHEVVGHASGKLRPEIRNPASKLGMYSSTLEEARADLVGLYWIPDDKLREMGIVPDPDAALAEYEAYARNALVQLRRVALGDRLEDDHMRNRQLVVHWLIDNSDAIAVERRDGKTYYRVTAVDAFREASGRLLGEIMRIKATGDFAAGKALVERYGTRIDETLHREVLARIEALGLPSATGFVQPELRLVHGEDGQVVDVVVHYPMSLAAQMLRFSGRAR